MLASWDQQCAGSPNECSAPGNYFDPTADFLYGKCIFPRAVRRLCLRALSTTNTCCFGCVTVFDYFSLCKLQVRAHAHGQLKLDMSLRAIPGLNACLNTFDNNIVWSCNAVHATISGPAFATDRIIAKRSGIEASVCPGKHFHPSTFLAGAT